MEQNNEVVVDRAKSQWSDLWKKEDYWAIWIGFFFLIVAAWLCFGQRPALEAKFNEYETIIKAEESKPFKTIEWYKATAAQKNVQAQKQSQVADVIAYLKTPARWTDNPLDALMMDQARADERNATLKPKVEAAKQAAAEALATAKVAQDAAAAAGYQDAGLNDAAKAAIDSWQSAEKKASKAASGLAKPFNRIPTLIVLGLVLGALCTVGAVFMGMNPGKFFVSFLIIYALCVLANILGNQKTMRLYGINAEIWSIAIGMIIANTIGTPKLVKDGAQVEYFIKAGLVLLGAEVLFHKILAIGIPGIFVAWVVTPIVLISTFIFGQKVLKMPSRTLNMVISADMSVCGTSAAIATAAACRAKKEELTLSIGLSLTFTAIMLVHRHRHDHRQYHRHAQAGQGRRPGGILHQGRSGAAGCRSAVPQDPGHRYSRHLRGLGGDPHRAHQHLHLRPEGAQDAFPYPEHGHFRRHVRVRYLGGHRHRRCLPRQEGRTDPVHRPVPDLHRHHDGGHARLHQLGGYA